MDAYRRSPGAQYTGMSDLCKPLSLCERQDSAYIGSGLEHTVMLQVVRPDMKHLSMQDSVDFCIACFHAEGVAVIVQHASLQGPTCPMG